MKTPNRHRFADFSAAESPLDPDNIRIRRPVPSSSFSIFRVSFFTNLTSSYSPVCTCPYRNAKKIRFFPSVSAHSFVQNTDAEKTDFLLHFSSISVTIRIGFIVTIQDLPSHTFAFRTLRVLFSPLTRLKMLICGGGALLGSQCMEIKVSYVQARRFIDFHTLILNSYICKSIT